jgi:hypothetical protein
MTTRTTITNDVTLEPIDGHSHYVISIAYGPEKGDLHAETLDQVQTLMANHFHNRCPEPLIVRQFHGPKGWRHTHPKEVRNV